MMMALRGKISDRIRSGEIPLDTVMVDRPDLQPEPKADSVKHAGGRGLGNGANRDGTRKK